MQYQNWGRLLLERFPPHDSLTDQENWEALKQQLAIGRTVCGVVIAKAPFGAWLDIGAGFPALLEIPDVEELTPERYRADEWCPIGATITAVVVAFNDRNRQVGVSQRKTQESPN